MDIISYILSKQYTDETAIQFGGLKGANCQVKSIVKQDGINTITLQWKNDNDETRESSFQVCDGTPIYMWNAGDHYQPGQIAIYSNCFYLCIVDNSDLEFDDDCNAYGNDELGWSWFIRW